MRRISKYSIVCMLVLVLLVTGCNVVDNGGREAQSQAVDGQNAEASANANANESANESESVNANESESIVPDDTESYYEYVEAKFEGEYNRPGLYKSDGSPYIMPEANPVTGKRINVLDFGAVANDPNFDNMESFKAAIESAEVGDEVYVPEGDYYFSTASLFSNSYVAHIVMREGVNFTGAGMDKTVLISNFDEGTNEDYKTAVIVARTVSDIVISDMSITSNTSDDMLPDPDVSNVNNFVGTAPVYGIVVDNDKPTESHGNVHIARVLVEKYQRMGMRIRVVSNVQIYDCVLQKATDLGGGGAGYGISIQGMTNGVDITGSKLDSAYNVVRNCTINGPFIRHGILLQYYTHNNLITGNTINDTLLDAIDLHGEDEYSNVISYNTISNARRGAAIGVGNSGATHDMAGPNNYIHNNTVIGGDRGIDVLYGTENTVVVDNNISGIENTDGTGIFVQNGPGTVIGNNVIKDMSGQEATGVMVLYSYNALEPEAGVPDGLVIVDNTFENLNSGVYVEANTDAYTYEGNVYDNILLEEYVNGSDTFIVPPISDVVIPKLGDVLLPTDDNFITNEGRDYVQTQSNMRFKSSYYDVPYNRMVYVKFDLSEANLNKEKAYLRLTGKSKDGLATINIYGSSNYTDWKESTITWNNALYHEDQVAKILDTKGELTHVTDFTFTTVGTEFNTYYIDVTDYVKNIDSTIFTLILVNDDVENMYCEIYSKETSQDVQKLALILSDE